MLSIPIRAWRGALAAILTASAFHASAQQSAASGSLEEIVVAAQKREQNSQDIGSSLHHQEANRPGRRLCGRGVRPA
jgi:hypothetical protein